MQPWDIAGSYQGAVENRQKIAQTDADVVGQSAAGNFVKSLFNGSVPGAQPMQPPMGGQPQGAAPPMQPPMGGQPQPPQPQAISAGGGMPQAPQAAVAALAQRLRSMVPGAQPMMPQTGQMPPQAGAGSPPPTPAGGPPGGAPSSPSPGGNPIQSLYGQMTLQQVAQGVVRSNPGIEKNPQALFSAMRQLMPLMRPDEAQYFRALQLQQQQQHNTVMEGIAQQRADTGDTRAATAGAQGQERIDLGNKKETRIAGQSQVRLDQGWQRLELSKQQLQRQIMQGGQRQLLGQWRAVLDAQHKRATEIIQGGNTNVTLTDEQKKQLKEENDQYEGEIKAMRAGQGPGGSPPRVTRSRPAALPSPATSSSTTRRATGYAVMLAQIRFGQGSSMR